MNKQCKLCSKENSPSFSSQGLGFLKNLYAKKIEEENIKGLTFCQFIKTFEEHKDLESFYNTLDFFDFSVRDFDDIPEQALIDWANEHGDLYLLENSNQIIVQFN